jgi:hypothetical protein
MRQIRTWPFLIKKKKGLKLSSRLLEKALKKAGIDKQNRAMGLPYLKDQLAQANSYYCSVKANHATLRSLALDSHAEAKAQKEGIQKASVIKYLKLR